MKRFQFLLLDAGPIIKLFELGLWETFLEKCDMTICRTVINQAKWADEGSGHTRIDLQPYEEKDLIKVVELDPCNPAVLQFYNEFDLLYKSEIHPGEKETLAYLNTSTKEWLLCSGDNAVFRVLGLLGKGEQGISLEEVLSAVGISQKLEWQYTKKSRERYTRLGQIDFVQGKGRRKNS